MRQDVDRGFFLALMGAIGMYLLFFASYVCWDGAWCWGPRVIIITVPLMLLPLAAVFSRLGQWKKWARGAVAFVLALSLMVQALPIGSNFYLSMIRKYQPVPQMDGGERPTRTFGPLQSDERYRTFFQWEYASVPNQAKDLAIVLRLRFEESYRYSIEEIMRSTGNPYISYYFNYYVLDFWWDQLEGQAHYVIVFALAIAALWSGWLLASTLRVQGEAPVAATAKAATAQMRKRGKGRG